MINLNAFKHKKIAVYGLGETGMSSCLALQQGGAEVVAWDDSESVRDAAKDQGIKLEDLSIIDLSQLDLMLVSPGIALYGPKVPLIIQLAHIAGLEIVGDFEIFALALEALELKDRPVVIGVTGTNGKSTTCALIAHILKESGRDARLGSNIGKAVLALDDAHHKAYYVLEASSYQLEICPSFHPDIAVLLNITSDHLERHGSMENYVKAKSNIFINQTSTDYAVISIDDHHSRTLCAKLWSNEERSQILPISVKSFGSTGVFALGAEIHCATNDGGRIVDLSSHSSLRGTHNAQNVCAAVATCLSLGISPYDISKSIESFSGLDHRMQVLATVGGITFVNDSKATNVESTCHALGAFENIFWIAGGQAKDDNFDPLDAYISQIKKAYFIGKDAKKLASHFQEKVDYSLMETIDDAVFAAYEDSQRAGFEKSTIILSPAGASFDQFKNFVHRGETFVDSVRSILGRLGESEDNIRSVEVN